MNKVKIHFTRAFTTGALKGLLHDEWIQFCSRDSAARWVRGIRRNARLGILDYKLTAVRIETIS